MVSFDGVGGLQAKSMTSQRYRAVTRWRICVTMATLWQQQDGGYALLYIFNSTVIDWTLFFQIFPQVLCSLSSRLCLLHFPLISFSLISSPKQSLIKYASKEIFSLLLLRHISQILIFSLSSCFSTPSNWLSLRKREQNWRFSHVTCKTKCLRQL